VSGDFKEMKGLGELLTLFGLALWFLWRLRRSTSANDPVKATIARQDLREGLEWTLLGALAFVGAWRWVEGSLAVALTLLAIGLVSEIKGLIRVHRGTLAGFAATNPPGREPFLGGNRAARRRFEREHEFERPLVEKGPSEPSRTE
jgi:hypothetical protein